MWPVMYRSTMPLTHRPARDGSTVDAAHVPAYLALELASEAWGDALADASAGVLTEIDVMIVNVGSDFSRELLVGEAEVEVEVTKIGRSSLTARVAIAQGGHRAAVATFVFVRVTDGRAVALTDDERDSIASLVSTSIQV